MLRKVFVYGTLKKGKTLHHLIMTYDKYLGEMTIPDYTLYSEFPKSYPYAVKKMGSKMKGEVYTIKEGDWESIKRMELNAGYKVSKYEDIYFFEYPKERIKPNFIHVGEEWN